MVDSLKKRINFKVERLKALVKPGRGTRKCKCRKEMKTTDLKDGRVQVEQAEKCETCQGVK